jgi:alpha-glucosidase (family GH31 glycosyl hydrolase)
MSPAPTRVATLFAAAAALSLTPGARAEQVREVIGDRIFRLWADADARDAAPPSVTLAGPFPSLGPAPADLPLDIDFGVAVVYIDTPDDASLYGTGLSSGELPRNGRFVECWNTDAFGWTDASTALYQSHPWVMGVRADGTAFGVLADTPERCFIDLTKRLPEEIVIWSNGPEFPVIYAERDSPQELMEALAELTGFPAMPPMWAVGYHQCRFQYTPQAQALSIAQTFRQKKIPCDVIWLDIGYMDGFRNFTFDPIAFPSPAFLDGSLEVFGFRSVWTTNPGAPPEPGYFLYDEGVAGGHWVREPDGETDFVGQMWPGDYVWADFTRAETRDWWADKVADHIDGFIDGVWVDMNEPAVFTGSRTMPEDNIHRADAGLGGPGPHARYHNLYGRLIAEATYEGMLRANPDRRPFVLPRANFIGGQRFGAAWTGDNVANQYHYEISIPSILNLGLSGQPFAGPDIGGFNGDIDPELFRRWMAVGALYPFSRGHTGAEQPKEPWAFGPDIEDSSRLALNRRYRLIGHIYTAFFQAHTQGLPVMRPLFFADPADPDLRVEDRAFLLGDGLIVSAVKTTPSACGFEGPGFPMPAQGGYRFGFPETNSPGADTDTLDPALPELYALRGSIIPSGPIIQTTADHDRDDPITLVIALDDSGYASGSLYEDAGDGFAYQTGEHLLTRYEAFLIGATVVVTTSSISGDLPRPDRALNVRLLTGDDTELTATGTDGIPVLFDLPADPAAAGPASPGGSGAIGSPIDGCDIPAAFHPSERLASQDSPVRWGDNLNELNELFLQVTDEGLRVGLTGNVDQGNTSVVVLLDTEPGGQPSLDMQNIIPPPLGLAFLDGTTFDAGFLPDVLLHVNADNGRVFADITRLPSDGPAFKTYLGETIVDAGSGVLANGTNPNGVLVAYSASNHEGINGLQAGASAAATARHGFEFLLPGAEVPLPEGGCRTIRVLAFIASFGTVSNQILPGVATNESAIGFAPDFADVPGDQFAEFLLPSPGDVDGDRDTDVFDFAELADQFGQAVEPGTGADLNGDGVVDVFDFGILTDAFGCVQP